MPIEGNAEKIQLMLETMGIEGINAAELAYDKLEKQVGEVEQASRLLQKQTQESKTATYDLIQTEYELVEAENAETRALEALLPARFGAARALNEEMIPATKAATVSLDTLGRRSLDAERAITALATGHGMMRLGPALDRIATAIGGPAGIGFAIGSMLNAMEVMVPQFLKWINADNAKHAKDIADATQKQADAAKQMAETLTTEQEKTKKATEEQIKEMPGAHVVQGITGALQAEALAKYEAEGNKLAREMKELAAKGIDVTGMGDFRPPPETVLERAKKMGEGIATTLGTSAASRREALRIAREHPGVLPADFAEKIGAIDQPGYMPPAERDKAMQAERAAEKEIATASEKEQHRIRADILKKKADNAARQREWDQGMVQQGHELEQWEKEDERKKNEEIKAGNDAKRFANQKKAADDREAAREARERARAATPEGRRRAERQAIEGQVEAVNQQYIAAGMGATPEGRKHQIAEEAIKQYDISGDIVTAVNNAIVLYNQHLAKQMARGLGGVAQQGAGMQEQVNGMQMFNAPGMWR
jgi:hypothetical protein